MLKKLTPKQCLKLGTVLAGTTLLMPAAAYADCLPTNAPQTDVQCSTNDPDGYQTTTNGVGITVLSGVTVGTGSGTPVPFSPRGRVASSAISATSTAAWPARRSRWAAEALSTTPPFREASSLEMCFSAGRSRSRNVFNNLGGTATLNGNINSTGALTVNNTGAGTVITGNITSAGALTVIDDGGFIGGNILGSGVNDVITIINGGTIAGAISFGCRRRHLQHRNGYDLHRQRRPRRRQQRLEQRRNARTAT